MNLRQASYQEIKSFIAAKDTRIEELEHALEVFVKRVEDGTIHSKITYASFKELLNG